MNCKWEKLKTFEQYQWPQMYMHYSNTYMNILKFLKSVISITVSSSCSKKTCSANQQIFIEYLHCDRSSSRDAENTSINKKDKIHWLMEFYTKGGDRQ